MKFSSNFSLYNKKAKPRKIKILIGIILILFVFSLNFYQQQVRNFFYIISEPVQKFLWQLGDKMSIFFESIYQAQKIKKESEKLKLKYQQLLAEITYLKEIKKENEILREALNLGLEKEFKLLLAEIIGKDVSQDFILINKGRKDGIKNDLPVITHHRVLVGKISKVYEKFSKVELLSNKESSLNVEIADKDILGLVRGRGNLKILLDLVSQDKDLKEGDLIITSSFNDQYPKGLLIGLVSKIKKRDIEPFQQAEIVPLFDLKKTRNLFIITNF